MNSDNLQLYTYYRSSAAYRVRIALNLKSLAYKSVPMDLLHQRHTEKEYLLVNPQGLVPALKVGDDTVITQSTAILEYLEVAYPDVSLMPGCPLMAARTREIMSVVSCDVHPLNNLRVLRYLKNEFDVDDTNVQQWYQHWVNQAFQSIEQLIDGDPFSIGENATLADAYLIPQVYNALRFNIALQPYPKIGRVFDHCMAMKAFRDASPEQQPDAPDASA